MSAPATTICEQCGGAAIVGCWHRCPALLPLSAMHDTTEQRIRRLEEAVASLEVLVRILSERQGAHERRRSSRDRLESVRLADRSALVYGDGDVRT